MLDESLLRNTITAGTLTPETTRWVLGHIASAVDAGASAVLVTCPSIGAAAELARQVVPVPVIRVDEAMVDEAVRIGAPIRAAARQDCSTAVGLSTGHIHATSPEPPEGYSEARHLADITTASERCREQRRTL